MRIYRLIIPALCILLCLFTGLFAQAAALTPDCVVEVDFFSPPGKADAVQVAVTLRPSDGHYIYGPDSTDGLPTQVRVFLSTPEGERALPLVGPAPRPKKDVFPKSAGADDAGTLIYAGPTLFLSGPFASGGTVRVTASGLLCAPTSCLPFDKTLQVDIPTGPLPVFNGPMPNLPTRMGSDTEGAGKVEANKPSELTPELAALFASFTPRSDSETLEVTELGGAVFFGLLAGLLLNLMPCVLPVVSLKFSALLAVSAMSDKAEQARAFRSHCLIFAAGILTWFMILALLLGGAGWAWGEMFQSPITLSILALILFVCALSLFGVFSLPLFDLKVSTDGHPRLQAFAGGLLATLLATPCSGPLLGGVLSWALLQPLPVLVLTVGSVGVGMALPYGIMALAPGLVHLLPRPGAWTIRLEQLLGFFLIGGTVYLVTLLPAEWFSSVLMCLTAVSFAAWLWGQIGHLNASNRQRLLARCGAVLVVALALFLARPTPPSNFSWEPFNPETFAQILGTEPILLEFTADWCPSCKALEHTTLSNRRMERLQNRFKMRTIRVDLSREDPAGMALLKSVGSVSIPVLAIFPAGEKARSPVILRDLITPAQLKEALSKTF